jgi:hypothetical protein
MADRNHVDYSPPRLLVVALSGCGATFGLDTPKEPLRCRGILHHPNPAFRRTVPLSDPGCGEAGPKINRCCPPKNRICRTVSENFSSPDSRFRSIINKFSPNSCLTKVLPGEWAHRLRANSCQKLCTGSGLNMRCICFEISADCLVAL